VFDLAQQIFVSIIQSQFKKFGGSVDLLEPKFKPVMVSGELNAPTWGVEFNLISTACILYTTLFKSPYWTINNYANY